MWLYAATTDVLRANPRTLAPTLNQSLPGAFALGVNYGLDNKKNQLIASDHSISPVTKGTACTHLAFARTLIVGLVVLAKQADAFLERCLDDPQEKAQDARLKVRN